MPIDSEPPDLSSSPVIEAAATDAVVAQATDSHHHGTPSHSHCQNCGTALTGPYCHHCGQHDFEFHQSFGHVLHEALENFFHFDAKLFRNIITLLFQPGRLTADFNAGKRASQMPPFRLYLFVSVLFFFVSFLGSHPASDLQLDEVSSPERQAAVHTLLDQSLDKFTRETKDPLLRAKAERAVQRLREASEKPGARLPDLLTVGQAIADEIKKEESAGQTGEAETPATDPKNKTWRADKPGGIDFGTGADKSELARFLTEKGEYAYKHQREMVESFIHALPKMLLFCLPFFALLTRVLFRKSGQVYLQHLIIALHFHTFIFLWVLVRNGWVFLAGFAGQGLKGWLTFGCNLWMVLYAFLMLRRLFANSWPKTIVKTGLLALGYTITLGLGFVATAVVLFLML